MLYVQNTMGKTIKVLDLFSGCGGLTEGFLEENYDFVGHVEMDMYACESLKTRILFHYLKKNKNLGEYHKYMKGEIERDSLIEKYELQEEINKVYNSEISDETYPKLLKKIRKNLKGEQLDLLIGGPPCQTYSNIGRSRVGEKIKDDPRNFLYQQYAKFLEDLQPEAFVFENVPGLRTAGGGKYLEQMKDRFEKAGYFIETDKKIEQYMPDYGIIQNRKRLIIIGRKIGSEKITNYPDIAKYRIPGYAYNVNDFLLDLPEISSGGGERVMGYKKQSKLLIELGIRDKGTQYVENHITRPIRELDREIYKIAVENYEQGGGLIYSDLPTKLKTHKNTKNFSNRFCVVKRDHKITNTVVAHISKDGHYYIHPCKEQNRSISIREAARIQSFPDNFKFEGPRTAVLKQIGNAVPPMFSKIIAKELKTYF